MGGEAIVKFRQGGRQETPSTTNRIYKVSPRLWWAVGCRVVVARRPLRTAQRLVCSGIADLVGCGKDGRVEWCGGWRTGLYR